MILSLYNTLHFCCRGFDDCYNSKDLSLGMSVSLLLFLMGVMHDADNTYSIQSTWLCCRYVQFLTVAYNSGLFVMVLSSINLLIFPSLFALLIQ